MKKNQDRTKEEEQTERVYLIATGAWLIALFVGLMIDSVPVVILSWLFLYSATVVDSIQQRGGVTTP